MEKTRQYKLQKTNQCLSAMKRSVDSEEGINEEYDNSPLKKFYRFEDLDYKNRIDGLTRSEYNEIKTLINFFNQKGKDYKVKKENDMLLSKGKITQEEYNENIKMSE